MSKEATDTAFIRVLVRGRAKTWLYAHALRKFVKSNGEDPSIVQYIPGTWTSTYLSEVRVEARLSTRSWESISAWSRSRFASLHADHAIDSQLAILRAHGVTGEEQYEPQVA